MILHTKWHSGFELVNFSFRQEYLQYTYLQDMHLRLDNPTTRCDLVLHVVPWARGGWELNEWKGNHRTSWRIGTLSWAQNVFFGRCNETPWRQVLVTGGWFDRVMGLEHDIGHLAEKLRRRWLLSNLGERVTSDRAYTLVVPRVATGQW
jgi:hypothetical protein